MFSERSMVHTSFITEQNRLLVGVLKCLGNDPLKPLVYKGAVLVIWGVPRDLL